PAILFSALAIWIFVRAWQAPPDRPVFRDAAMLGLFLALAVTTKEAPAVLFILPAALAIRPDAPARHRIAAFGTTFACFAVAFVAVWQIHFTIARHVNSALPNS